MSKPIFEDLFKFSGRRNRKSYNLLFLIQSVVGLSFYGLTMYATDLSDTSSTVGDLLLIVSIPIIIAIIISTWATGSQRFRDVGYSGWYILTTLLPIIGPFVSIAIMIKPSSVGENKYGPSCI